LSEVDAAVLSALFSESSLSLYVLDRDLRLVRFNPGAERTRDFPVESMVGQPLERLLTLFDLDRPDRARQLAHQVLKTGKPVLNERFTARSIDPPVESVHAVGYMRLHDEHGAVLGVVVAVTDVTERANAEARLRLLNLASTRIGTTLDVYQTATELADVCVPRLADSASVDVLDSVLRGEAPAPGAAIRGQLLRRAAYRSATGGDGVPAVGEAVSYPEHTPYDHVLATLRSQLLAPLDPTAAWLDSDPRGDRLREVGVHAMMTVPLAARGVVLGLANFYRWRNPIPFSPSDLELAEQIGAAAALCLDNARLYTRERSVARLVGAQGPRRVEESIRSAVETAHAYLPAGTGGAWSDVIALSGSRVALVVGDRTGLGAYAAAAMGELRAASAALSGLDLLPDEILERLHDMASEPDRGPRSVLRARAAEADAEAGRETCLYVVYDPATRTCSAASAGHPPPVVAYPDGRVEELYVPRGPALGQGVGEYAASEHVLPEGAVLFLHNDVFPEAHPEQDAARGLLARVSAASGASLKEMCDAIIDASTDPPAERDVIVLLARTRALHSSQTAAWTLTGTPETAGQARRLATTQLKEWGIESLTDSTELIVSELVTNALRHAAGPIGLRLICDRSLTCEVTDDSNTAPRLRRAHDDDEGGRGLFITEQLTQRWGARPNRHGKTIWAEQPLDRPALPGASGF
jgi:anti-sigma regulatory factor (Ser/Thr protein kinase)